MMLALPLPASMLLYLTATSRPAPNPTAPLAHHGVTIPPRPSRTPSPELKVAFSWPWSSVTLTNSPPPRARPVKKENPDPGLRFEAGPSGAPWVEYRGLGRGRTG